MANEMQKLKSKIVKMICGNLETMQARDTASKRLYMKNLTNFQDINSAAIGDILCVSTLRLRLSDSQSLSSKETTLIDIFWYLIEAEGVICNFLNFISFELVVMHHDLYSFVRRRYVNGDFEGIRKIEMSSKIQFLKKHGFSLLTKEYDSTFRNDIAHHNYKVDEDGVLWVRGKPIDLSSKVGSLMKILDFINDVYEETIKTIEAYGFVS